MNSVDEAPNVSEAMEYGSTRDRIDYLAVLVQQFPDVKLHPTLAERLRLIANELLRRADR
jgi:hypothetical protein